MARFELDENYIVGQHPEGYEDAAQFCVVEADNDGRVRIRGYDLLSDTFFCDYYIENVNNPDTFAYTYKNMKAHDRAPVFAEDTQASAALTENGDYRISFTEADVPEGYIVHEYEVSIADEAEKEEIPMNTFDNEVKQRWGNTDAYKEIKRKTADYSADKWNDVNAGLNAVLAGFALALKGGETPENQTAQLLVGKLQQYITDNFYTCTDEILAGLGQMYAADDRFKTSIDKNGEGTAEFISEAIKIYCK